MSLPEHQPAADWVPPTWEQIVRDHSSRVYRFAVYRLTGNPHDAEDLTRDVFVRVFRSLHRFQPGTLEGGCIGSPRNQLMVPAESRRSASTGW